MDNIFFVKFIGYFMFITGSALMLSKESRVSLLENMKHNDSFLILFIQFMKFYFSIFSQF